MLVSAEMRAVVLVAILAGLAVGAMLAWTEIVLAEQEAAAWRPPAAADIPPHVISEMHEEVRRIQREAGDDA